LAYRALYHQVAGGGESAAATCMRMRYAPGFLLLHRIPGQQIALFAVLHLLVKLSPQLRIAASACPGGTTQHEIELVFLGHTIYLIRFMCGNVNESGERTE